ncbi:MAG: hypothetical protein N2652_08570 [Kiritimatiellae bacterium]|nr:hypothetical protein [Kiritimatiellia bacterium]
MRKGAPRGWWCRGAAAVWIAAIAHALRLPAAEPRGWAAGVRAGTIGLGGEVAWAAADWSTLRLVGHGGRLELEDRIGDVEYGAELDFANVGILADLHAPQAAFRITLGYFYHANEWVGRARPSRSVRLGGIRFSPAEIGTLRAEAEVPASAGYAGVGFGNPFAGGRWTVTLDVGAWWFFSEPDVRLSGDGTASGLWVFREALREEERQIAEELPQWWPVLMLGVVYRFG